MHYSPSRVGLNSASQCCSQERGLKIKTIDSSQQFPLKNAIHGKISMHLACTVELNLDT